MHIDYKATIWFRIPIEQREVLDKCIDILMSGGTINDLYNDIDENDIGPCEILYDTEEQISPQENQDNPTIEAHIDKEGTMDTEIIWQNFDYDADISPKDTQEPLIANTLITRDDVLLVAQSLKINPTEDQIQEVISRYDEQTRIDPTGNMLLWIDYILNDIIAN